ncbi:tyrosine-type recombinase/integrase [Mesorhizobium sp. GbtcB19]|uniref:tyrosine-type recombinase/integrase n=1 Tax=Mesorhizobium sp. GbtcB19 TaxID=2824764 RepID=UPI001C2FAA10|nr:tyrosine-type recombinase/integrase [Mesorhizobium sp. GbtcB19]
MALKLLRRGKIWYIRGTVRGIRVYFSTKVSNKALADEIRIKTEHRLLEQSIHGEDAVATFGEAAEAYLARGGSNRFLTPLIDRFGQTRLRDIKQDHLDALAQELLPNMLPQTRNRQVYTPFIAVWNHAAKTDLAKPRPWLRPRRRKGTNAPRLTATRSGTKPVNYGRAAAFLAAISPAPAMLMLTLFYTGLRPIEAFALEAEDINVAGRWIVIRNSKTDEPRGVPMHEVLVPLFEALLKRRNLATDKRVFRTPRGKPYSTVADGGGGLKSAIQGARRRTGENDISPYTARHSVSTQLVVNGVHAHIKDQILGHVADGMSRHYTNVPQEPLIAAINTLPVPDAIKALPWWENPLGWSGRLAEGTGRRTDLERKRMALTSKESDDR